MTADPTETGIYFDQFATKLLADSATQQLRNDGVLRITVRPNIPPKRVPDAVLKATLECNHTTSYGSIKRTFARDELGRVVCTTQTFIDGGGNEYELDDTKTTLVTSTPQFHDLLHQILPEVFPVDAVSQS